MRYAMKQENMTQHTPKKRQAIKTASEKIKMLDLMDKNLKIHYN